MSDLPLGVTWWNIWSFLLKTTNMFEHAGLFPRVNLTWFTIVRLCVCACVFLLHWQPTETIPSSVKQLHLSCVSLLQQHHCLQCLVLIFDTHTVHTDPPSSKHTKSLFLTNWHQIRSVYHEPPLRWEPVEAVQGLPSGWGSSHANHGNNLNNSVWSTKQIATYIFIELGETGAEVEDRRQVSTNIASDFHWFRGSWTLERWGRRAEKD